MKPRLTFLGSGSAFYVSRNFDNWQSNLMIEVPCEELKRTVGVEDDPRVPDTNKRLLLDLGGDVRHSLHQLGLGAGNIDAVYVSHNHNDHIGGSEYMGFSRYFVPPRGPKYRIIADEDVMGEMWAHGLQAGMGSIEGKIVDLNDYGFVERVSKNGSFDFEGLTFNLVQVVHFMNGRVIVPSHGLLFDAPRMGRVFWTSDTQFCPEQIKVFYNQADVIFQDCETGFPSGVHAHYNHLNTLPAEIKAKMWLYHYQPGKLPDAVADGFHGFVVKHQSFDL